MATNIILLARKRNAEQCYLMSEGAGYGVLDTACTKTVAGTEWMNEYMASLTSSEHASIERSEPSTQSAYRFRDGAESQSIKTVDILILFPGNKIVELEVDIMNNKSCLLISQPMMTELGFITDTKRGEIKVDDTNDVLKLGTTASGHFKMSICCMTKQECHARLNNESLFGKTTVVKQ